MRPIPALSLLILLLPLLLTGCQSDARDRVIDAPPRQPDWSLTLERSGGFAGLTYHMVIHSRGEMVITRRPTSPLEVKSVDDDTLASLHNLSHGETSSAHIPTPGQSCHDCYYYRLTIREDGRITQHQTDSSRIGHSPYRELITTMLQLGRRP